MGNSTELRQESASKRSARRHRQRLTKLGTVTLRDVRRLRYRGLIADSLKPLAIESEHELSALTAHLGGEPTAVERAIAEDAVRLGLLAKATFAVYLRDPDPELAKTVSALTGQRRASLALLGLACRAKELDLHDYIAQDEP